MDAESVKEDSWPITRLPRKVEIVHTTYQPTKAEKEEEIDLLHLEGMTPEETAAAVVQDVEIKLISSPKK